MEEKKEKPVSKENTPLGKHAKYFGGGEDVSYSSMVKKNDDLGMSWWKSRFTAFKVSAGGGAKISSCPFSTFKAAKVVGTLNHPRSTGLFNLDGTINEDKWNELLTNYSETNTEGVHILTEPQLYKFVAVCRKADTRADPLKIGESSNDGEWGSYWELFSKKSGDNVRYVTIKALRDFLEDSAIPGEEVEASRRAAP